MKLGVALSGGGIRGIAHAGALKALEESNIKIDIIGGCSSGSLIASLYAMGYSPYYIYILFKRYAKEIININTAPIISGIGNYLINKNSTLKGFHSGENLEKAFNRFSYKKGIRKISDIKMPLVIPSVDILNSKEYIFTNYIPGCEKDTDKYISNITVGKSVHASSCFPAAFSPCKFKNHLFMDGGILDNIPVEEVKKQGADKIIAIAFHSDDIDENSNVMDYVMKTVDIMGKQISEKSLSESDYILDIYTDKCGLLDISKLDSCYKYGYDAVMNKIDEIKKVLCI